MGTISTAICALFFLQLFSTHTSGEPSYYRQSRILSGYDPYNSYYTPPKYTYYTNPYVDYYPQRYSGPVNDDNVYITDKYGRTSVQSSSSYRAMQVTTCTANTCGQNAQCQVIGGRPVCSCFRGYSGDPISYCKRQECSSDYECRSGSTCRNGNCIDVCAGTCGANANCDAINHVPRCSCPSGYTGDPFTSCRPFDPSELCHPSPCGQNTNCEVINGVPTCKCLPGFRGSPLAGCRHECESDSECGSNLACIEFKCQNPCSSECGENAQCETINNHRAVCKCPKGYFGNPHSSCRPECYGDVDCPAGRPACFYGECKNPCVGVCGVGANCELRGLTPVCSCPRDMTGNPFVSCRPFEARDLCEPNPCAANARCEPGFETRTGKERPVCFCHDGYIGDGVKSCVRGECMDDSGCPDSQACIGYRCLNPCTGQCGVNANCNARRHIAVCTCPTGYNGDALVQCHQDRSTAAARYLRYKRKSEAASNSTVSEHEASLSAKIDAILENQKDDSSTHGEKEASTTEKFTAIVEDEKKGSSTDKNDDTKPKKV